MPKVFIEAEKVAVRVFIESELKILCLGFFLHIVHCVVWMVLRVLLFLSLGQNAWSETKFFCTAGGLDKSLLPTCQTLHWYVYLYLFSIWSYLRHFLHFFFLFVFIIDMSRQKLVFVILNLIMLSYCRWLPTDLRPESQSRIYLSL